MCSARVIGRRQRAAVTVTAPRPSRQGDRHGAGRGGGQHCWDTSAGPRPALACDPGHTARSAGCFSGSPREPLGELMPARGSQSLGEGGRAQSGGLGRGLAAPWPSRGAAGPEVKARRHTRAVLEARRRLRGRGLGSRSVWHMDLALPSVRVHRPGCFKLGCASAGFSLAEEKGLECFRAALRADGSQGLCRQRAGR